MLSDGSRNNSCEFAKVVNLFDPDGDVNAVVYCENDGIVNNGRHRTQYRDITLGKKSAVVSQRVCNQCGYCGSDGKTAH
ncbi:MAG: hypothetical protein ABIA21_01050 [Candidatus Aenigmatarchaeota archaeon]